MAQTAWIHSLKTRVGPDMALSFPGQGIDQVVKNPRECDEKNDAHRNSLQVYGTSALAILQLHESVARFDGTDSSNRLSYLPTAISFRARNLLEQLA